MDIQDLPDPTIGKLELRDYGYTAEDMVPLRKKQPWIITGWVLRFIAWAAMAVRESM